VVTDFKKTSSNNNDKINILIICRQFDQISHLTELVDISGKRFVVASDDIRVHRFAEKLQNVAEAVWISQMDSIFSVADEVISIISAVNDWFETESDCHPELKDLLYWPMHCEGGPTSQRVLDFLLLEKSYEVLIVEQNPKEVIIINDPVMIWENNLLFAIARKHDLLVKIVGALPFKHWLRKNIWFSLRPFAVSVFRTIQVIKVKLKQALQIRKEGDDAGLVAIQLLSNSTKHIDRTKNFAKSLKENGLDPIILSWGLGSSQVNLQRDSYKYLELENWVRVSNILLTWYQLLISRWNAGRKINNLLQGNSFFTNPQVLQRILKYSVLDFYFNELFQRTLMKCAIRKYFSINRPRAFCTYSATLPFGVIFNREYHRAKPEGLLFLGGEWPYHLHNPLRKAAPIESRSSLIVSCFGELHQKLLINLGLSRENLPITGLPWLESILFYKSHNTREDSRKSIGINSEYNYYIMLDVNGTVPGYLTTREQIMVLDALFHYLYNNKNIVCIIKPHPGLKDYLIEGYLKVNNLPNIILLDKNLLPYDAINAADVLITKTSTLALEAMYLDVPTIGVVLDKEEKFECYSDGSVDYVHSLQELTTILYKLTDDINFRREWENKSRIGRQTFLSKHGIKLSSEPFTQVAKFLKSRID
jgi:hypothetical protein